jgi:hypothetical protein
VTRAAALLAEPLVSERKFIAPPDRRALAAALLEQVCLPDPGHPHGTVCSVYFDRPGVPCYHEKLNGDFLKTKLRLRWYLEDAERDPVPAWVEIKRRFGGGRLKSRRELPVPRALLERAPWEGEELGDLVRGLAAEMTGEAMGSRAPLIQLRYERDRYLCPFTGARVSLDSGIRAERCNPAILPYLRLPALEVAVLEIKMPGAAGEVPWLGRLAAAGFRHTSFSKFGALISHLT